MVKPKSKAASNKTKAKAKPKAKAKMTTKAGAKAASADRWWAFIEKARKDADGDGDEQADLLVKRLQTFEVSEIVAFDRFLGERIRDAFRSDLWAVAYIMNGGCSDDGFDYFIGWLIARGKKHYEAALNNPEDAGKGVSPDDEPFENEVVWYVASNAYEAKTGKDDYYDTHAPEVRRTLIGKDFDEDTVDELYPKLAARFGG